MAEHGHRHYDEAMLSVEEALESLKELSLPAWARRDAEDLVDFLAHRDF